VRARSSARGVVYAKASEMKEVIASSDMKTMMNSGIVEGSKNLHDFHNDLMKDSALGAMWLPKQID